MNPGALAAVGTRAEFEDAVTQFANFLKIEYHTEEVNVTTKAHTVNKTSEPLNLLFAESGKFSTPYVLLNSSLIKVRGDPYLDHRFGQGSYNASNASMLENRTNPITTFIILKPDEVKLKAQIDAEFYIQPNQYINQFEVVDQAVIERVLQLQREAEERGVTTELTMDQIEANVYQAFLLNCTKYMTTIVVEDKVNS